jgi:hypothetical protein
MSTYTQWIQHKGKKILFCNYAGCNEAQYLAGVTEMEQELMKQPTGTKIPLLIDVTKSSMTIATRDRGKQTIEVLTKANITTDTAMVGISGIQKIIAQAISKDVHYANDMESAKDWLVSH